MHGFEELMKKLCLMDAKFDMMNGRNMTIENHALEIRAKTSSQGSSSRKTNTLTLDSMGDWGDAWERVKPEEPQEGHPVELVVREEPQEVHPVESGSLERF